MEQLIFFALIIFFSIVESVARSKKRKAGGPLPEAPPDRPTRVERRPDSHPRPTTSEVPSYDSDPSFDDAVGQGSPQKGRATSSESMIPSDIWDEIAGMTREPSHQGPTHTAPRPAPQRVPAPPPRKAPQPTRPKPALAPKRTPMPKPARPAQKRATILAEPAPEGVAAHSVHLSHADYGTDPSSRAPSAQDRMDPLQRPLGQDASAIRGQLRGQGAHALRQAVILLEVLGPPASERKDRF